MQPPRKIPAGEARNNFGTLLHEIEKDRKPVIIMSRGKHMAMLVPMPDEKPENKAE